MRDSQFYYLHLQHFAHEPVLQFSGRDGECGGDCGYGLRLDRHEQRQLDRDLIGERRDGQWHGLLFRVIQSGT